MNTTLREVLGFLLVWSPLIGVVLSAAMLLTTRRTTSSIRWLEERIGQLQDSVTRVDSKVDAVIATRLNIQVTQAAGFRPAPPQARETDVMLPAPGGRLPRSARVR